MTARPTTVSAGVTQDALTALIDRAKRLSAMTGDHPADLLADALGIWLGANHGDVARAVRRTRTAAVHARQIAGTQGFSS